MPNHLQLRGHHLGTFALHLSASKTIANASRHAETTDDQEEYVRALYGAQTAFTTALIYHALEQNPRLQVEIVDGLDAICRAECPKIRSDCAIAGSSEEDIFTLRAYGLEAGKTYTARQILRQVNAYAQRTGLRSPREEFCKILASRMDTETSTH